MPRASIARVAVATSRDVAARRPRTRIRASRRATPRIARASVEARGVASRESTSARIRDVARRGANDAALDAANAATSSETLVGLAFGVAAALLVVITGGMAYIAAREALDRREEADAREDDARRRRVTAANEGKLARKNRAKTTRMTPSQRAAMETREAVDAREDDDARATATRTNRSARRRAARDANRSET